MPVPYAEISTRPSRPAIWHCKTPDGMHVGNLNYAALLNRTERGGLLELGYPDISQPGWGGPYLKRCK